MKEQVNENDKSLNEKKKVSWKNVTIGGVSGILLGAVSPAILSSFTTEDDDSVDLSTNTDEQIDVSTENANDESSFASAFNEARTNLGPDGVFEWHGQLYSTHTTEEWNEMSESEQNDFANQYNPQITEEAENVVYEESTVEVTDIDITSDNEESVSDNDETISVVNVEEPVVEVVVNPQDNTDIVSEVEDQNEEPEVVPDYYNGDISTIEEGIEITEEEQQMLNELDQSTDTYVTSQDEVGDGMEDYMSSLEQSIDPIA